MIQKILPNSEVKLKILKTIYKNPDINFSELVKKSKTSPNIVMNYVNELVKNNVVKDKRIGGKNKTHIRLFQANFSTIGIDIFSYVELNEKEKFLKKYAKLKPILNQLSELLPLTKIKFCLIYGSFARFSVDKGSDLDIWLVGALEQQIKNRITEIFSTLDREYNISIETEKQFLNKINDPLHQNILQEHIIIYGEKNYLKLISKS